MADELPHSYQVMLFWAGLRGAVGVALAAGLSGSEENVKALQATVLVVVVLTVIIFGGTTARMLEIMGIRTGVVEEVDSDDEFDIETTTNGTYYKRSGTAFGHTPTRRDFTVVPLDKVAVTTDGNGRVWEGSYSSGNNSDESPPIRPTSATIRNNSISQRQKEAADQALLGKLTNSPSDDEFSDSDLPPAARRRSPKRRPSPPPGGSSSGTRASSRGPYPTSGSTNIIPAGEHHLTATGVIRDIFTGTSEDHAALFTRLDDLIIKPTLLLDQSSKGGGGGSGHGGGG